MKSHIDSHVFWGLKSPFSALTGAGLIILASGRFAFAVVCASILVWVYVLTALAFHAAKPIMPSNGRNVILLFLSSFLCGLFILFVSLLNPLLIMTTTFFLLLIPPFCLSTGFFETIESPDIIDTVFRALLEAVSLAGIILAFALIREPLGLGTLSVPSTAYGIRELFSREESDTIIPAQIISVSSGGLLLLGYGTALYRYIRENYAEAFRGDNDSEDEV
jgi:hypothetical protein